MITLIDFYVGKDFNATFTFKTSDGTPINITGYTVNFTATRVGSDTAAITKQATISDALNGVVSLSLDPSETTIQKGLYSFKLEGVDDNGETHVFEEGDFVAQ